MRILKKAGSIILIVFIGITLFGCNSAEPTTVPTTVPPASTPLPTSTPIAPVADNIKRVSLTQSYLLDGEWKDKFGYNVELIKGLDCDRLLYWYYDTAGLTDLNENNEPYGEWENNFLYLGNTMGHYLTACSMLYTVTGEEWYKQTVDYCVTELAKCQQANGYLLAQPISRFDHLEAGDSLDKAGVPYYFVSKIMIGITDAYVHCGNEQALDVAKKMANWIYTRMSGLNSVQLGKVRASEYGDIGLALYDLYDITGEENTLAAARLFQEPALVGAWANEYDNLAGKHANTHVPKPTAMFREFLVSGNKQYYKAVVNFFDMVLEGHTLCQGGNAGLKGHFGQKNVIYGVSCEEEFLPSETCNKYNMIKIAQYLYEYTGEMKYIDYMERTLLNGIMGSINKNGGKTYYQYLHFNARKVFSGYKADFWCCTGTGMESFAKVPQSVYHNTADSVRVNIYISTSYTDGTFGMDMVCSDEHNEITVTAAGRKKIELRVPYWTADPTLTVNGEAVTVTANENGYAVIERDWQIGDKIEWHTPYTSHIERTPDEPGRFTFFYGPYLMVAVGRQSTDEVSGSFETGWLAELTGHFAADGEGTYTLTMDSGKTLKMQKYGIIERETFTTYFKQVN